MKIGIEAQRIFRQRKHGMDYVVLEELKRLQKMETGHELFVFVKPGPDRCLQSSPGFHVVELNGPSYPLWEQVALPLAACRYGIDLLHCTSNTAPILCHCPLLLTLHDIIFLEKRDGGNKSLYQNLGWHYRRWVVPRILGKCRRIITVSDFERQNILGKLSIRPERVVRIYNGYNCWFTPKPAGDVTDDAYRRYINREGYFFFIGNTDPKKNTERTILAYARYWRQSEQKRPLLLADFSAARLQPIIERNGLHDVASSMVLTDYVDNRHLPSIYRHAFAFLYTSLRESFGIPLLEAMACATPVVTSNTSSMPEIGGSEAALVDPFSEESISGMMLRIEREADYRNQLVEWGLQRARLFSWDETARQLLQLYDQLADER